MKIGIRTQAQKGVPFALSTLHPFPGTPFPPNRARIKEQQQGGEGKPRHPLWILDCCQQQSNLPTTRRSPTPAFSQKNKEEEPNKKRMWIVVRDRRSPSPPSLGGARKEERIRRTRRRRKENMLWTLGCGSILCFILISRCVFGAVCPQNFRFCFEGATLISPSQRSF